MNLFMPLIFVSVVCVVLSLLKRFRTVPILLYHFVDGEGKKRGLSVSFSAFEQHLQFLLGRNFRVISLGELVQLLKGKSSQALSKMAVISFDDGDKGFYTKVYPLLVKYQIPAAIFVITDWIGREGYLSWEDINSMSSELVTIGSHTMSHRYLPELNLDEVRRELVESKRILEEGYC